MNRKTMKASWLALAALMFALLAGDVRADTALVRGEINLKDGPEVSFSVPVAVLQALKTSGMSAMVEDKEALGRLIDALMSDLGAMKDEHLLVLKVENEVEAHVWVEQADPDDPMRANCVCVDVAPGHHEPEISLRLPQGFFFLGSFIGNQFMEAHGKEALKKMIEHSFLAKIKQIEHGHGHDHPRHEQPHHEQPHHEPPHHEQPHHGQPHHEPPRHEQSHHGQPHREQSQHGQPYHDQPTEEVHRHIGHLKEKIDHLHREGRHDEAHGLEREADDLRRKIEEKERGQGHQQPHHHQAPSEEMHRHLRHLKEKMDFLRREGRHEEAKGLEHEADETRRKIEEMERGQGHQPPHHERSADAEHRTRALKEAIDHMFEAAKGLRDAHMHEVAEELARKAEEYRREINR